MIYWEWKKKEQKKTHTHAHIHKEETQKKALKGTLILNIQTEENRKYTYPDYVLTPSVFKHSYNYKDSLT